MSFYRNIYLKSEDWQSKRLLRLASVKGRCSICKIKSFNNDVHHIVYRDLYSVLLGDLKVLCRRCHDVIHVAMKKYPEYKKIKTPQDRWLFLKSKIKRYNHKGANGEFAIKEEPKITEAMKVRATSCFRKARRFLLAEGIIKSESEMKWDDRLIPWYEKNRPFVSAKQWLKKFKTLKNGGAIECHPDSRPTWTPISEKTKVNK